VSFISIGVFSLMPFWGLGLACLALFGYLSAISSLLQYTLIQTLTPDGMLGRINGLWTAQNVTGDAVGAAILGAMTVALTPVAAASSGGFALTLCGIVLAIVLVQLRRFQQTAPEQTEAAVAK
jgi:ENTS family enterobactin (siderophore) exporter